MAEENKLIKFLKIINNYLTIKDIKKVKRKSWKKFCQIVSDLPSNTKLYNILAKYSRQEVGSKKRPADIHTESDKETLKQA